MLLLLATPPDAAEWKAAVGAASGEWKQAGKRDGVTVFTRRRVGSPWDEAMAVGVIDATPEQCARVIDDLASFAQWMPYLVEVRVLEPGVVYHRVRAPLIAERDYVIRFVDESDGAMLRRSWRAAPTTIPPRPGVVRVRTTEGAWIFEPRGEKTIVRHYVYSDPGGSVPAWLANAAAVAMLPDVVNAVRERVRRSEGSPTHRTKTGDAGSAP